MKKSIVVTVLLCAFFSAMAEDEKPVAYVPPVEPEVQATVEKWQDLKFGLFIHWGIYSQLGCVESWSLCHDVRSQEGSALYAKLIDCRCNQVSDD